MFVGVGAGLEVGRRGVRGVDRYGILVVLVVDVEDLGTYGCGDVLRT